MAITYLSYMGAPPYAVGCTLGGGCLAFACLVVPRLNTIACRQHTAHSLHLLA